MGMLLSTGSAVGFGGDVKRYSPAMVVEAFGCWTACGRNRPQLVPETGNGVIHESAFITYNFGEGGVVVVGPTTKIESSIIDISCDRFGKPATVSSTAGIFHGLELGQK